jgi:hypothetical protein
LLYRTWLELYQDPTLASLFKPPNGPEGERIEAMEHRNVMAFEGLPRLQVYLASTTEEQRPTQLDITQVRIFIGLRFDFVSAMSRLEPGTPTFPTVISHVKKVLKANHQMVTMVNGIQVPLADGGSHQEGAVAWIIDEDESGSRITLTAELEWVFTTNVNFKTGRIANIERAETP